MDDGMSEGYAALIVMLQHVDAASAEADIRAKQLLADAAAARRVAAMHAWREGLTMEEIGLQWRVSAQRVSQIIGEERRRLELAGAPDAV